ncbi:MAG TPA: tetratricopeptide repeat protein [Gaiellaceae bacterium]|nr:tetratricopeptide repeat protein [Gaiellaceae bacterium]
MPNVVTRRKAVAVATASLVLLVAVALGGTLRGEDGVRAAGGDARSLTRLGITLQQRWRETADASYLARSGDALRRALALAPGDPEATSAFASLALSQHRFRDALAAGRQARRLAPGTARNLGIVGDALLELGRYEEAFAAYDALAARKPGLGAYARVAHARELIGQPRAAMEAMRLALDAAGPGEPQAWTHVELAKLHFGLGELGPARRHARAALAAFPGYVYALDLLARIEFARGDRAGALSLAERATRRVPLPQFVGTLADLRRASGRGAGEQLRLVGAIERVLRAGGIRTDLETALFDVDHGRRLADALARARRAYRERPSIDADDVLGWALTRSGRCDDGLRYAQRALRLGTLDASKLFHLGMALRCAGRPLAARHSFGRALRLNPYFSPRWAPVARNAAA